MSRVFKTTLRDSVYHANCFFGMDTLRFTRRTVMCPRAFTCCLFGPAWVHFGIIMSRQFALFSSLTGHRLNREKYPRFGLTPPKGRIPDVFLRGCGLSDWEIENAKLYNPDLSSNEVAEIQYRVFDRRVSGVIQISPVFISYSHADGGFVDVIGKQFDQAGVRYWRDVKDATSGRLDKVIDRGISLNPTVLLVLSKHAVESEWVEFEVDKAVEHSRRHSRDVLCPVALDAAWLESDRMSGQLRTQIKKYVVLDFSQWTDAARFAAQFRKLCDGLGL